MILKMITLMNTWKIQREHRHPLVFTLHDLTYGDGSGLHVQDTMPASLVCDGQSSHFDESL